MKSMVEALEAAALATHESNARKAQHEERKAKAEADQAELVLEFMRKQADMNTLPVVTIGRSGGKS